MEKREGYWRLIEQTEGIRAVDPLGDNISFMHAVLAQVGLPRRKVDGRSFARTSGGASVMVQAGQLFDGRRWVDQPLPYGPKPRVMLMDICSYAVEHRTQQINVGGNVTDYLRRLGWSKQGGAQGPLTLFKRQAMALAACSMRLGIAYGGQAHTISGQPIKRFSAWLSNDSAQPAMWPAQLELSADFYESLLANAVPLDKRAIRALSGSALSLDLYTWLAHRLHRLGRPKLVYWKPIRDQFGQEYNSEKNFKHELLHQLKKVKVAYPAAKIEAVAGGLMLRPSQPPVAKKLFFVDKPVD